MTEANANGPAPEQTTAPEASAAPAQVQTGASETWAAGLQVEDNRALVEAKKWGSPDDAVKSYRELESALSKSVRKPADDAPAEEWDAFWKKIGAPDKPEAYEFKLDTATVPEDFPYDLNSVGEFRNWAHEAKVTPQQAQKLHDKFVAYQAAQFKAAKDEAVKQEGDAHRAIVGKWGEPTSETYKQNVELVGRAAHDAIGKHPGLKPFFEQSGLLASDGAIRNADFADWMLSIAKELHQEGTAGGRGDPASSKPKDAADILYGS